MVVIQRAIKDSTPSGGRKKEHRGKKLYERGNHPSLPSIAKVEKEDLRMKGGGRKIHLLSSDVVNLLDAKTKKYQKATIKIVTANTANRHFVRRNILTKGAVIETDKGKAKIINRPGQEGQVIAVLI